MHFYAVKDDGGNIIFDCEKQGYPWMLQHIIPIENILTFSGSPVLLTHDSIRDLHADTK